MAARLQRPSWKDWRLVVGVLLVLVAIVAGARVVAAADDTVPVFAAAHALVPGQPVTKDDLTSVRVHLEDVAASYVDASDPVDEGTFALRPVREGELVPASALTGPDGVHVKTLTVPVDPTAAQVLVRGSVVDIWVNAERKEGSGSAFGKPDRVLDSAVVARVPEQKSLLGAATVSVQVVLPEDTVQALIAAVDRGDKITLVPAAGSPLQDAS
jgi:hypothetical protein